MINLLRSYWASSSPATIYKLTIINDDPAAILRKLLFLSYESEIKKLKFVVLLIERCFCY